MNQERPREDLALHLKFIRNSCEAYDKGDGDEALRIAQSLRTMFHRSHGTPLIQQLGAERIPLWSNCGGVRNVENSILYDGLHMVILPDRGIPELSPTTGQMPALPGQAFLPADEWWNQVVFVASPDIWTRQIIACDSCNKQVAHSVENLPARYERLREGGLLKIISRGKMFSWKNHHFGLLRTMGCEVLSSPELLKLAAT